MWRRTKVCVCRCCCVSSVQSQRVQRRVRSPHEQQRGQRGNVPREHVAQSMADEHAHMMSVESTSLRRWLALHVVVERGDTAAAAASSSADECHYQLQRACPCSYCSSIHAAAARTQVESLGNGNG